MDDTTAKHIEQADWGQIAQELCRYADKKLRRLVWRGCPASHAKNTIALANGMDGEDFALAAISSLLDPESTRNWDPEKCPDILVCLKGIVRSMISNACTKLENAKTTRQFTAPGSEDTDEHMDRVEQAGRSESRPDQDLLRAEQKAQQKALLVEFRQHISSDAELSGLFEAFEAGIFITREVAEWLDIPAPRVSELKRKLESRMDRFMSQRGIDQQAMRETHHA